MPQFLRNVVAFLRRPIEIAEARGKREREDFKREHKARVRKLFEVVKTEFVSEGIAFCYDSLYRSKLLPTLEGKSAPLSSGIHFEIGPKETRDTDETEDTFECRLVNRRHLFVGKGSRKWQAYAMIHDEIVRVVGPECGNIPLTLVWDDVHKAMIKNFVHDFIPTFRSRWCGMMFTRR